VDLRVAEAAALAALVIAAPAAARANGAFPAAEAVLVPADRPQEIMLVTNFGVVLSEDGAQSWSWSCEQATNALGMLYQLGPAPRRRLFAVADQQVVYSDDTTCSWRIAGGLVAGQSVTDVFPDPTNADRVLSIAVASAIYSVFESADGGATFGTTLYQAAGGETVTSVESARSDPRVVYIALMGADQSPRLARSSDAGAHWAVSDLGTVLGPGIPRIIAVDPADAGTVLLRWSSVAGGEAIAVTHDGGATAARTLDIEHYFTSFARLADGALMLSAVVAVSPAQKAGLFLSHDGGATFQENDAVPGVFAIAARGGTLYAAADNFGDGYALGASTDEGASFQPVVRFDQIGSIMACLRSDPQCQASCEALAGNGLGSPGMIWDEAVCKAGTGMPSGAGGSAPAGTGGMGGGTAGAGGSAGGTHHSSGGGCSLAPGPRGADLGGPAAAIALLAIRRRRVSAAR
jgi:hypothetical protein